KVLLLWVATHVGEWQNGDRRPVGECWKFRRGASWCISTSHRIRLCQTGLAEGEHQGLSARIRLRIELALQEGNKVLVTLECVCPAPGRSQCADRQAMRILTQVVDCDRLVGDDKSLLGKARLKFKVA